MRKVFILMLLLVMPFMEAICQPQSITKFLGIPVTGTKQAMIKQLEQKGFTYDKLSGCLEGEFNGRNVNVNVVTNNNKVWRIMLFDAVSSSEIDIRIRFNTLCSQFANNKKYVPANIVSDYEIPENEDISYNMTVLSKRYEASYWQTDQTLFLADYKKEIEEVMSKYPNEITNALSDSAKDNLRSKILAEAQNNISDKYSKNSVWFMIYDDYGKYRIIMYYDNEYNHSNGEDL